MEEVERDGDGDVVEVALVGGEEVDCMLDRASQANADVKGVLQCRKRRNGGGREDGCRSGRKGRGRGGN